MNEIVPHYGFFVRVSVIAYLRHSCYMATYRRDACEEAYKSAIAFVRQAAAYQLPGPGGLDFARILNHAGEMGVTGLVDRWTNRLVTIFLLFKPTLDKQASYLSPIAHCIRTLAQKRNLDKNAQLELVFPATFLNNTVLYTTVLKLLLANPDI